MRRATLLFAAATVAACSTTDFCEPAAFEIYDPQRDCFAVTELLGCFEDPQGTEAACSVDPEGRRLLSRDGHVVPGGRACTPEEAAPVIAAQGRSCPSG